ncbi:hypothetical protein K7X08_016012 [Anisodus acutangulus]|uniref:Uncharacterized protein n=1 Tax=Anisodus acutangulus TaxID=402998 RepID=A0A9Q1R0X8_9SOLA|nr:hypothetical protein K7X08_016012 [Anisodus acutangulus]
MTCYGINKTVRFSQVVFAADLDSSKISLLIEVYGKSTVLDLGQSLNVLCMNTSHDSSRFLETNVVFSNAKRAIEEREWDGLFEIENEGSNSIWLEECDWNHIEHQLKVLSASKSVSKCLEVLPARTFAGTLNPPVNFIEAKEVEQCLFYDSIIVIEFWDPGKSYEQVAKIVTPLFLSVLSHDAGGADKFHASLSILECNMPEDENTFEDENTIKWSAIKDGVYSKTKVRTNSSAKVIGWCDEEDVGFDHQFKYLTSNNTFVLVSNAQLSLLMQVTAIVIVIALIGILFQFWLAVVSNLLILKLSFSQYPSYKPHNIVHSLNFDYLVAL